MKIFRIVLYLLAVLNWIAAGVNIYLGNPWWIVAFAIIAGAGALGVPLIVGRISGGTP